MHTLRSGKFLISVIIVLTFSLLTACGGTPTPEPTPTSLPLAEQITLYGWGEDVPESVKEDFTAEFGVSIEHLVYDSQEEAMDNIKAGQLYDVVVLDNNNVAVANQDNILAEITPANVVNFNNILPSFRDLNFDPQNRHSIPFTWGTTAVLVRSDLADRVETWQDVYDLHTEGKIAVRDEPRETLGFALKALGYSMNTSNPEELEEAVDYLLALEEQIELVGTYPEEVMPQIESGEVVALIAWVDDALYAKENNVDAAYVYPEGTILWGDSFVIPSNSPNKYTAEVFLNFLMRPEIAARITNESYYVTANQSAGELLDEEIRNDPVVIPPSKILESAEITLAYTPEEQEVFDQVWNRLITELGQ